MAVRQILPEEVTQKFQEEVEEASGTSRNSQLLREQSVLHLGLIPPYYRLHN